MERVVVVVVVVVEVVMYVSIFFKVGAGSLFVAPYFCLYFLPFILVKR